MIGTQNSPSMELRNWGNIEVYTISIFLVVKFDYFNLLIKKLFVTTKKTEKICCLIFLPTNPNLKYFCGSFSQIKNVVLLMLTL